MRLRSGGSVTHVAHLFLRTERKRAAINAEQGVARLVTESLSRPVAALGRYAVRVSVRQETTRSARAESMPIEARSHGATICAIGTSTAAPLTENGAQRSLRATHGPVRNVARKVVGLRLTISSHTRTIQSCGANYPTALRSARRATRKQTLTAGQNTGTEKHASEIAAKRLSQRALQFEEAL